MKRLVGIILLLALGGTVMGIPADAATLSPGHQMTPQPTSTAGQATGKPPAPSATKNKIQSAEKILTGQSLSLRLSTTRTKSSSHIPVVPAETRSSTNSATDTPLLHPHPVLSWRSLLPGSIQ